MNSRIVKYLVGAGNAQESRALLERLRADPRNFLYLGPRAERAVLLAVFNYILRADRVDTGNVREQRSGSRVDVYADAVDTVLDHSAERFIKPCGLHIVLILTDADRLRVDLDKLRQRVLNASRDRDRGIPPPRA